jgi:hypothetical protein
MSRSQVCDDLPPTNKMQFFAGPLLHAFVCAIDGLWAF